MSTYAWIVRLRGQGPRAIRILFCTAVVAGAAGTLATLRGDKTAVAVGSTPKPEIKSPVPAAPIVQSSPGGTLVICGGGKLPQPIRERFCGLAGGAQGRIVVIPTATAHADDSKYLDGLLADWKGCGVGSVRLLHTRSRDRANDRDFVQPLSQATGVWLSGGDQSWLTAAYLGTEVERQLKELLARGGVIGGTSAGAAVMSGVMISGGFTKADVSQGFDFINGAVIDQHFLKRNRVERLVGVLSSHPNLVGLGIDEETALVVDVREHHLSVIGDSYVVACVPDSRNHSVRLKFLKSGDQTDLADLKIPTIATAPALGLGSL
jgi:cyanophycinase